MAIVFATSELNAASVSTPIPITPMNRSGSMNVIYEAGFFTEALNCSFIKAHILSVRLFFFESYCE